MSWLLDTCVLSEYAKKAPAPQVIAWLDEQDEESLFISVISLGEIEKGILKLRRNRPAPQPETHRLAGQGGAALRRAHPVARCRRAPTSGRRSPPTRNSPGNPCR